MVPGDACFLQVTLSSVPLWFEEMSLLPTSFNLQVTIRRTTPVLNGALVQSEIGGVSTNWMHSPVSRLNVPCPVYYYSDWENSLFVRTTPRDALDTIPLCSFLRGKGNGYWLDSRTVLLSPREAFCAMGLSIPWVAVIDTDHEIQT